MRKLAVSVLCLLTLAGCASTPSPAGRVGQVEIGMSAERVEAVLGQPDAVQEDARGYNLWLYEGTGGDLSYVIVKDDKVVLTHP